MENTSSVTNTQIVILLFLFQAMRFWSTVVTYCAVCTGNWSAMWSPIYRILVHLRENSRETINMALFSGYALKLEPHTHSKFFDHLHHHHYYFYYLGAMNERANKPKYWFEIHAVRRPYAESGHPHSAGNRTTPHRTLFADFFRTMFTGNASEAQTYQPMRYLICDCLSFTVRRMFRDPFWPSIGSMRNARHIQNFNESLSNEWNEWSRLCSTPVDGGDRQQSSRIAMI